MLFSFRLWLAAALIPLAGSLVFLGGTAGLSAVLMAPYDGMAVAAHGGILGTLGRVSVDTIEAAARAATDDDVRDLIVNKQSTMPPKVEATLLAQAGMMGAPSFALLVAADGAVIARAGADAKLEDKLTGFPVVAAALTGVSQDGLHVVDKKPYHLAAASVYDGASLVGAVVVGWAYDAGTAQRLSNLTTLPVVFVTSSGEMVGDPGNPGVTAQQLAGGTSFGDLDVRFSLPPLPAMKLPLPLAVPETTRYLLAAVPLYPGVTTASAVALIDRNPAYRALGMFQAGTIGGTLLLGLLVVVIIATTLRSINKPLAVIIDHLSQFHQGTNVGILPESALSGPFVRLGKQLNMILQMMPSASRLGTAPLTAPLGGLTGGALSAALGSTATPTTLSAPQPHAPTADPEQLGAESSSLPALSSPPAATGSSALSGLFDDGPDPLAAFRVASKPPQAAPPPPPPPSAPAPAEGRSFEGAMGHEATVMFQVPQELLTQSQVPAPSVSSAPSFGAPPLNPRSVDDNRTVAAAVPHELLAQLNASPHNPPPSAAGVPPGDETHYKEVYEKFVQTRVDCGEETGDLTYDRFVAKLLKNRQQILEKHKARSVRFQVYVKDGKAALRALPVRE